MDPNEVDPSLQILFHGPQDSTSSESLFPLLQLALLFKVTNFHCAASHAQITPSNFYSSSTGGQEKEEGTAESLGEKRERRSTIHFGSFSSLLWFPIKLTCVNQMKLKETLHKRTRGPLEQHLPQHLLPKLLQIPSKVNSHLSYSQ